MNQLMMPDEEKKRFERLIRGQADRFGISAEDYLRKVWYHEQASRLGEYIAMVLLDELLKLAPQEVAETLVETT